MLQARELKFGVRIGEAPSFNLVFYTCKSDQWGLSKLQLNEVRNFRSGLAEVTYMSMICEFCQVSVTISKAWAACFGFGVVLWGGSGWYWPH